jgi:hypothetical protein
MARPRRAEPRALALLAVVTGGLLAAAAPVRAAPRPATEGVGAPATGGALRVIAEPARLVLGREPGADLTIQVPPEVEEISVTASVGRIEGVHRLPAGGFAARFRPPTERFPQVAIVAVTAHGPSGPLDGWLAIPLSGQGDARVRASPGQIITLRVGERTFGPAVAGEDGLAVIPVVVPPGVREAHHGFRPVDLHVPETPLVHAVAHRATVQADRAEQVRVVAYVVAPHGAARRGDEPVLEPSRGSVSVSPREAGAFEVVWTLPPGAAGEERLVVRLPGAPASKALVRVGTLPGAPAAVALSFDRDRVVPVGDARPEVLVTARVVDAAGNTTAGGPLEVGADAGTLSRTVERAPGVYEARLEVPRRFGGRREIQVTARGEAGKLYGARSLSLFPGPPAAASVERRVLVADGAREASLRVVVLDRHGNPVAAVPTVTAALGRVLEVAADGEGASRVRYLPPAVERRSEERLALEVGGLRSEGAVLLVPPRSQDGLIVAAGVAAGRAGALGPRAALAFERDAALAPLGLDLSWRLEAEWTSLGRRAPGDDGAPDARTSGVGALLVGASARRELGDVTAWASGSAGLVHEVGERGAAPAGRLALGLGWPQRRGMPFVEGSVLAADRRALPAFAVSAGVRFGGGESRGDDPDRR